MPDLIRHPDRKIRKHAWIPGQARNDKTARYTDL